MLDHWCEAFYSFSQGRPEVVWQSLLLRKRDSWALSLTVSSVVSMFVTPLSCFLQSRCNSLAVQTPVLLSLLLDLDTYCGVDRFGVFLYF